MSIIMSIDPLYYIVHTCYSKQHKGDGYKDKHILSITERVTRMTIRVESVGINIKISTSITTINIPFTY